MKSSPRKRPTQAQLPGADRLLELNKATWAILSHLDWGLLLETIVREGARLLRYRRAAIYFPEGSGPWLVAHALSPNPAAFGVTQPSEVMVDRRGSLAGRALDSGNIEWAQEYQQEPRLQAALGGRIDSPLAVAVPLIARGDPLAVLGLGAPQAEETPSSSERQLMQNFAVSTGLALKNAQLFSDARRREEQLLALGEITHAIYSRRDVDQVLETIYQETRRLIPLETFTIGLLSGRGPGMRVDLRLVYDDGLRYPGTSTSPDAEMLTALRERRVSLVLREPHEVRARPEARPHLNGQAAASVIHAPMLSGDEVLGLVSASSSGHRAYTRRHAALLQSIADQAAIAIQNARLYEQAAERVERLAVVNEVVRALNSTLDLPSVMSTVALSMHRVVPADRTAVTLYNPEDDTYEVGAVYSPEQVTAIPRGTVFALSHTSGRAVVDTCVPVIDEDLSAYGTPVEQMLVKEGLRSRLIVPVVVDGKAVAGLSASSREPGRYQPGHVDAVQDLAAHVAVAWKNSRLYRDLQHAYTQFKAAQEHLVRVEKLRALGQMSEALAHDFNDMLANIVGQLEVLLEAHQGAELTAALRDIRGVALHAAESVRHMQHFSRSPGEGQFEMVDLNRLVAELVERTRQRWQEQARAAPPVQLVSELVEVPPVQGDPSQLREVLTNMLFNALDNVEAGGVVGVSTALHRDRVALSVRDTGRGMPEEVSQQVFDPVFRARSARPAGLGMSMAYSIVARHGGHITVESEQGRGTTFTVWLPLAREEPAAAQPSTAGEVHSVRILIVDDDPMLSQILGKMLELDGHQVVDCAGPTEALRVFKRDAFDLVITDLGMPEMNGWELADSLYSQDEAIPIVILTGWGINPQPMEMRRHHVVELMSKPYTIEDVRAVIRRHARGVPGLGSAQTKVS